MEIVGKKSLGLDVACLEKDKVVILKMNDPSLNFYVTDTLKETLKEILNAKIDEGYKTFVLNMGKVKVIDSCGVGLIIAANNLAESRESKLYLTNIKPFITKIFEIMRIHKHLNIFETEEEALREICSA